MSTIFSQMGNVVSQELTNTTNTLNTSINAVDARVSTLEANPEAGTVLQVVGNRANYAWGSIGHASPWALSWIDVTLVTKGDNSRFIISGRYAADDTNSAAFGIGIGSQVSISGGAFNYVYYPAAHEDYQSTGGDTYMVARMTRLTQTEIQVPAGTSLTFRLVGRFNNSNGQQFLGNGGAYYAQEQIIQEITNV